jgi:nicotinamidase-related amidase
MNTALLIIDVQNDYFEGGAMSLVGSDKASENIKLLLKKFRTENHPILHIQHIATSPSATFFVPNTIGAEIHDNIKPLDDEKVIIKHYPNSFHETDLLDHLKSLHITNLIICGMMTHMCIDATTRAAKDLGFNCTLIADACATKDLEINGKIVTAENVHNSFLAALNYFYSTVTNTNEYLREK